jgi:hypothetical protein
MAARRYKPNRWSLKQDRELIELSKQSLSLEAAAKHFATKPLTILKTAKRLGLSFRHRGFPKLKAKGKRTKPGAIGRTRQSSRAK